MASYDVGDFITFNLDVSPWDASTIVGLTVTGPDGVANTITASQDADSTTVTTAVYEGVFGPVATVGAYDALWTVAGTGESISQDRVIVLPVPPVGIGYVAWLPSGDDVAAYVPTRTLDLTVPGTETFGSFSENTTPTDQDVSRFIDASAAIVAAKTGTIDPTLWAAAKAVTAMRAAALVELAYPVRDADINTADALQTRADAALTELVDTNTALTGVAPGLASQSFPQYSFPDPYTFVYGNTY